jgi:50S ribosomal protein L16 3-hydroxylase
MKKISWPILGKLSQEQFLKSYWQKKPLLMKGALSPFPEIITPDEVAGLCCDERIQSRLILERDGKTPWEVQSGPFDPSIFAELPKSHWTVLVNGVDRFIPEVHSLIDQFSFIPFWRIDDVMISVAYDQGNVGAHVDNYDVFLVQAAGRREWQIEDFPQPEDNFIPDLPIRLLKDFNPTDRWVLEPGDILYLPPRFAHHGIAQGDGCMTISVGFRAPTLHEIVHGVISEGLMSIEESELYTDPELAPQKPGEISHDAITKIKALFLDRILRDEHIGAWLGTSSSQSYEDVKLPTKKRVLTNAELVRKLSRADHVVRVEGSRMCYVETKKRGTINFFANGVEFKLSGAGARLGRLLADRITTSAHDVTDFLDNEESSELLKRLLKDGLLVIE